MAKAPDAFRTISEVAEQLDTPAHVLRFWESKFTQVKPVKRAGGRRYYRPDDMALLGGIKVLLHDQGMTIKGAQKVLRDQGIKSVMALARLPEDDVADTAVDQPATPSRGVTIDAVYTRQPLPADDGARADNVLSLTITGARHVAAPALRAVPMPAVAADAIPDATPVPATARNADAVPDVAPPRVLPDDPAPRGPVASRLLGDLVAIDPQTVMRRSDRIGPLVARLTRLHARMTAD
ncbi:MerR HTH family regulatory protein [Loktanella fryxellensis]|uniref:MerR HTH family regulatory protein n=1 Tax=Loktanella fryxellensis TaxID=245187 RepID=A0A1H7YBU1_9RHOB|nr:MerR family transcriptional regulator [Loktanella fryxellensis]SEM42659.1 MerR HTH family regulatory protein [Loktanella fryxellensis]